MFREHFKNDLLKLLIYDCKCVNIKSLNCMYLVMGRITFFLKKRTKKLLLIYDCKCVIENHKKLCIWKG